MVVGERFRMEPISYHHRRFPPDLRPFSPQVIGKGRFKIDLAPTIVVDNGAELISKARAYRNNVRLHFIEPGKLVQNDFSGKLQRQVLRQIPERALVHQPG